MGHILSEWFHTCVIYLTNQTRTPQIGGPWVEFSPHTCFVWPTQCFWRIWISCQHLKKNQEMAHNKSLDFWLFLTNWKSDNAGSVFLEDFNQLELRDDTLLCPASGPFCSLTELTVSYSPLHLQPWTLWVRGGHCLCLHLLTSSVPSTLLFTYQLLILLP